MGAAATDCVERLEQLRRHCVGIAPLHPEARSGSGERGQVIDRPGALASEAQRREREIEHGVPRRDGREAIVSARVPARGQHDAR